MSGQDGHVQLPDGYELVLPPIGEEAKRAWGDARLVLDPAAVGRNDLGCYKSEANMRPGGWSSLHVHPSHVNAFRIAVGVVVVAARDVDRDPASKNWKWRLQMLRAFGPLTVAEVEVDAGVPHLFFSVTTSRVVESYLWNGSGWDVPTIRRFTKSGVLSGADLERAQLATQRDIVEAAADVAAFMERTSPEELAGLFVAVRRLEGHA